MNLKEKYLSTHFLINFKNIKDDKVIKNFLSFLNVLLMKEDIEETIKKYSSFVEILNSSSESDFSKYIKNLILFYNKNYKNENEIIKELEIISDLAQISYTDIQNKMNEKFGEYKALLAKMPFYKTSEVKIDISDLENKKIFIECLFLSLKNTIFKSILLNVINNIK